MEEGRPEKMNGGNVKVRITSKKEVGTMNIAWSHVQKRIALVRLIATFSRDKRDIERGWIRSVGRLKASLLSLCRPEGNSFVDLSSPLSAINSLSLRDFSDRGYSMPRLECYNISSRNIGREEIELQRFDLIDEIYSKGCTYDRNMRHTIVLVFVRPKLRVNPVIKKYGGQKGGDDSESFRFIAAR